MFAPLLCLSVLFLALTSTLAVTCENVPISFSSSTPLLATKNLISVGTVHTTLSDGTLSVVYDLTTEDSSCVLVDALHVTLVSTNSDLGVSVNPAPGRFPCKVNANGEDIQTLTCDISTFDVENCCADTLRLFIHGVVRCDGDKSETAFAGNDNCSTKRWCRYEDVSPIIDCPTCQKCSPEMSNCSPEEDGTFTSDCEDEFCNNDGIPSFEVCEEGSCAIKTRAECPTCQGCDAGACTNLTDGKSASGCDEKFCNIDGIPIAQVCMEGACGEKTNDECATCQGCVAGVCTKLTDGMSASGCDEKFCNIDGIPIAQVCMEGACGEKTNDECATCQGCVAGVCTKLTDGMSASGCDEKFCNIDGIPIAQVCMEGACGEKTNDECATCQGCVAGACTKLTDGMSASGCDEKFCNIDGIPIAQVCMEGACGEKTNDECATCQGCVAGVCTKLTDGMSASGCDEKFCNIDGIPIAQVCMEGACSEKTNDECATCQGCVAGVCTKLTDGMSASGCDEKFCNSDGIPSAQVCMEGACGEKTNDECPTCNMCVEEGGSALCKFDVDSPLQDVCSTCKEQCTQSGDTGSCMGSCPDGFTCIPGDTDNLDMCIDKCTANDQCDPGESCIDGECESDADCTDAKAAFCDEFFKQATGTNQGSGKCCPDTSACVDTTLNLENNAVCSTTCGVMCSLTEDAIAGSGVKEVYCAFGSVDFGLDRCDAAA